MLAAQRGLGTNGGDHVKRTKDSHDRPNERYEGGHAPPVALNALLPSEILMRCHVTDGVTSDQLCGRSAEVDLGDKVVCLLYTSDAADE